MVATSIWTQVPQTALEESPAVLEFSHLQYQFTVHNLEDSIFLVCDRPNNVQLAFRVIFAGSDKLEIEDIDHNRKTNLVKLRARGEFAVYNTEISFPDENQPIVRYTTSVRARLPLLFPFMPKDIVPLEGGGKLSESMADIHMCQQGTRSGLIYFSMKRPKGGSVFYYQNLTALASFCEVTQTSAADLVTGKWPEVGFCLPCVTEKPMPANRDFIISDAFVLFDEFIPKTNFEVTQSFLNHLATMYRVIPRPATKYHNWLETAEKGLEDLRNHKGCWTHADGHPYLNAYVSDYKTPAEIMVQLAVLLPLIEYQQWKGEEYQIVDELIDGLPAFYDEKLGTVVRWLPAMEDNLDKEEEQKQERVMDSWYLHHPLLNLTRLARMGNKVAKNLLLKSVDYAIKVAHHFNYEWPVFYRMGTLEVMKAETEPGKGGEKDVPGAYAHLMLELYELTGQKRYLDEAKKAARHIEKLSFDIFYQANNTAFAAGAMLRLYKLTKDETYLNISYACIAGIMRNVQLWDCDYGYGKYFPSFFGVFPLNTAPYVAAYEEQEVFAAFNNYLVEAKGVPILESVRVLLSEFIKYAIARLPYYYPPMLDEEMFVDEVKTGEIDPKLWIPLEDIQDGWKQSGEVGQEVYGAGNAFGIVPRQYFKIPESNCMIFSEYPVASITRHKGGSVTLKANGTGEYSFRLMLLPLEDKKLKKVKVEVSQSDEIEEVKSSVKGAQEFVVSGGAMVKIKF